MKTAYDIILKPVITEASIEDMQNKKYTFRVARDANKIEIKNAVEEIFKVEVDKVTTINMKHECVEKGHREAVGRLQDHRVLRQPDVKRKESDNGNEDI